MWLLSLKYKHVQLLQSIIASSFTCQSILPKDGKRESGECCTKHTVLYSSARSYCMVQAYMMVYMAFNLFIVHISFYFISTIPSLLDNEHSSNTNQQCRKGTRDNCTHENFGPKTVLAEPRPFGAITMLLARVSWLCQ